MTEQANALRAARTARGWSQIEASREIAALAQARGVPVAAVPSLKSQLSRWENGHAVPDPQYRSLLCELYERDSRELGIEETSEAGVAPDTPAQRLRAAVATATAHDGVVGLWREQLDVAVRLDHELGAAGAGELVRAQVHRLEETLVHSLTDHARQAVAGVLAAAAALAGAQALDRAEHDQAWRFYDRSRATAGAARMPATRAAALAGLAAVLVDAGDPAAAIAVLGEEGPAGPSAARSRWAAARGTASAAAGDATATGAAFTTAARALRLDRVEPGEQPVELADLHRWHGHALADLGDGDALGPLELALAAGPRSARHRAGLHADLARVLRLRRPADAAEHARAARELAARIGSVRITTRLDARPVDTARGGTGPVDDRAAGAESAGQPGATVSVNSSAAP